MSHPTHCRPQADSSASREAEDNGVGQDTRLPENERLRAELASQRQALAAILDIISDALVVLDASGEIILANDMAGAWLGTPTIRLPGNNLYDLLPEEEVESTRRWIGEANATRSPQSFKNERQGRIFGHKVEPYMDPGTRAAHLALLTRDITDNEKALTALTESEARYRAIIQDQTELIRRCLPDGRLTFVNKAYARYHQREPQELIGTDFAPQIPEKDLLYVRNQIGSITPLSPVVSFEHRVIRSDDQMRWQNWTHRGIFNEQGELVEYQAVGYDITERKFAEMEVRENRAFLKQVIDTVPSPIFVKDRQGRFVLVNEAMGELYGASPTEMLGHTGSDFNPAPEETTLFRTEDLQVLDAQRPMYIPPRTITDSTGHKRWFITTKLPIPGKDQVLGVATDITERIESEAERSWMEKQLRQSQKMQALGTLAGGIAHDFNNIIFAILGFTRLAIKRLPQDDDKLREYLNHIQTAGLRASDLVRQILTFSRQTEQERKPLHVGALFDEMVKMLRATLPSTIEIELTREAENDTVLGDTSQVHQVLMNLCTNAAHAMGESGGTLKLYLGNAVLDRDEARKLGCLPGRFVDIRVADTGHGIDPAIIDHIFDPFFTTKGPGEGTGMGLSVVHGIIKAHNGAIHVDSVSGRGSSFRILLPRVDEVQADQAPAQCSPTGQERILFVEDESSLVQMAQDMLSQLGYEVTPMTSPIEALELFRSDPRRFDLVVTDQTMPGMSGLELASAVMDIRPDIPVILITGYAGEIGPKRAQDVGIKRYLLKPVVEEQLARSIREVLDDRTRGRS